MKDIGKAISVYFYMLALCSLLAFLYTLLIEKQTYIEVSWAVFLVFGNLMRKHNNGARRIVIGYNILCLILVAIFIPAGAFSFSNTDALKIFSISIPDPTPIQIWGFATYFITSSLLLVISLMSNKAKKEFSTVKG